MNKKTVENILKDIRTYKARCQHAYFIALSHGNNKLKGNARVSFLIWNIPAVITCPFATDHCIEFCYARKSEKMYPDVLPSRQEHFEITRDDQFVARMIYTICVELDRPINKNKKVVFRIHESGDFYNMAYVKKMARNYNLFQG